MWESVGGESQPKGGVGSVGRLLLLAYLGGCLTISETCMSCPLSGRVSHCFSCPCVIGLIEWLCLMAFFFGVVSMVLVLWELVLFYQMVLTTLYYCIGTVVRWLVVQYGSAVVRNRHLESECRFRFFS